MAFASPASSTSRITRAGAQFLEGTGSLVLDRTHRVAYACVSPRTDLDVLGDFAQQLDYDIVAFEAPDAERRADLSHQCIDVASASASRRSARTASARTSAALCWTHCAAPGTSSSSSAWSRSPHSPATCWSCASARRRLASSPCRGPRCESLSAAAARNPRKPRRPDRRRRRSRLSRSSAAAACAACWPRFISRRSEAICSNSSDDAGTRRQNSACLPARLADRQPAGRPTARRRGYSQAGQRQCRRHQCPAHAGSGVRALGDAHRHRQGLAGRGCSCRILPRIGIDPQVDRALARGRLRSRGRARPRLSRVVWIPRRQRRGHVDRRAAGPEADRDPAGVRRVADGRDADRLCRPRAPCWRWRLSRLSVVDCRLRPSRRCWPSAAS